MIVNETVEDAPSLTRVPIWERRIPCAGRLSASSDIHIKGRRSLAWRTGVRAHRSGPATRTDWQRGMGTAKSHLQRFRPQEIQPEFLAHPKLAARFFAYDVGDAEC